MEYIDKLQDMINESNDIVVFTGAGVSTDSGLKDFRSDGGLYNIKLDYNKRPEYMLSCKCFYNDTKLFFDFYKKYIVDTTVKPNITHKYLKKLEDRGKLKAIVTQNIDGLHGKAGNENVYEIHGTIYENYCINCYKNYSVEDIIGAKDIPKCSCGGIIKPNVVLYGEMLPNDIYDKSVRAISECDMLLVLGTSLTVYPASDLISYFKGKYLVIINRDITTYDNVASLVIHDSLKNIFNKLK